jgi:hypothetical protein
MEAKWEGKGSVSDIKWDDVLAEYDVREDALPLYVASSLRN